MVACMLHFFWHQPINGRVYLVNPVFSFIQLAIELTMEVQNISAEELNFLNNSYFNPHINPVTEEQWIAYGLTIPVLLGLSLILNGLILLLLHKDKLESSMNIVLKAIAVTDIFIVVLLFWILSIPALMERTE